jgi:hypothetical protein
MSNPHLPPSPHQIHVQQRELGCTAALSEASIPLQGTTVSTLTTDSSLVDLLVDSGGGEGTTLLPLTSIFIVPLSKKVPTARTERRAGYASGVVKCSCRGINHGQFVMC